VFLLAFAFSRALVTVTGTDICFFTDLRTSINTFGEVNDFLSRESVFRSREISLTPVFDVALGLSTWSK
jgi:hypothetical protein